MTDIHLKVYHPEASHFENTVDSEPIQLVPNAPCNSLKWKKSARILMVASHSMIFTFMAAGIVPAYDQMAETYGITVTEASYLASGQVCRSL